MKEVERNPLDDIKTKTIKLTYLLWTSILIHIIAHIFLKFIPHFYIIYPTVLHIKVLFISIFELNGGTLKISHLMVEHSRFSSWGTWKEMLVNDWQYFTAYFRELIFNPMPVTNYPFHVLLIMFGSFLLFNWRQNTPGSSSSSYYILIANR